MAKSKKEKVLLPEPSPHERFFAEMSQACLLNDDFMRVFFKLDGKRRCLCTQYILRILTGIRDLEVKSLECQADLQAPEGGRGVRLDVLAYDTHGNPYDIEMQRAGSLEDIFLRAYYNRAMLAVRALAAGKPFRRIHQHFVIFITEHDLCRLGKAVYEVGDPPIIGTGLTVKSPGHILIANAAYRGDDELGQLMHDIRCTTLADMHETPLKKLAGMLKEPLSQEKDAMGGILDEIEAQGRREGRKEGRIEGRKEGRLEGRMEGKVDMIRKVMKEHGWSVEKTLAFFQLSDEDRLILMPLL